MNVKVSTTCSIYMFSVVGMLLPALLTFVWSDASVLVDWVIIQTGTTKVTLSLVADWVSLSFSLVVCTISGSVFLFSSSYMSEDPFLKRFVYMVVLFVLSMNILIFIPSLPALLLGWDGLGIISFALVVYYQNMKSMNAGMLTVLMNRVGDVMILLAIALCVLQGHWVVTLMWEDSGLASVLGFMVMVAGMTKSAQIPFSSWLPAAMAAPTPVSALVHSSTLVTAGVYLLVRFNDFLSGLSFYSSTLLLISVMTLLMAGIGANYESDLKKVIALSTLSQLGVMMLGLAMGSVYLALFHLYTHALFKALLFLCAGNIIHNSGHCQDLRSLGMSYSQLPVTGICFNVANLSLCGAPFLSGFYSKDLILETSMYTPFSMSMGFCLLLATGMTSAYSIRLSLISLWGKSLMSPFHSKSEEWYVVGGMIVLVSAAVSGGTLLQSMTPVFSSLYVLSVSAKVLPTVVVGVGGYLGVVLYDVGSSETSMWNWFMSNMWFLSSLSSQPLVANTVKCSSWAVDNVDAGWLEWLGGQGVYQLAIEQSSILQRVMIMTVDGLVSYIFLFMVWSMVL